MSGAYQRRNVMMGEAYAVMALMQGHMREAIACGGDLTDAQRTALRDNIIRTAAEATRIYQTLWDDLGLGEPTHAEIAAKQAVQMQAAYDWIQEQSVGHHP